MTTYHTIASGRAMLAVETVGSGDPVVFLHANVGDRRMWRAQMDGISAGNMAVAYDRRGFGDTRGEPEDYSAISDLMAVLGATAKGRSAILVGCSQGGRIAIDTALRHPSAVRGLVLISPTVTGAPDPVLPPDIKSLLAEQKAAEAAGDLDRVIAIKARLWLDGPLQPEGRVTGRARQLFLDMNATALRSSPLGMDMDAPPGAFQHLGEIAVPALVICGDMDFPHIQERCRAVAGLMPNATHHVLPDAAHVPSLDRPAEITALVTGFIARCRV
ncbi:alpha/beta hydrolase [Ferrovibrio terrae]|uniref:alpha/beta fold hydrolase n=1 Tax=Ferrovibrio terrae TaxID=2594003 RepID=UPI0031377A32